MGFLEFIFDNFFIVLIVVFGLINLFSRMISKGREDEERQQQGRPERSSQTQTSRQEPTSPAREKPQGNVLGRMAEQFESTMEELSGQFEQEKPKKSISEQQQQQYEQLKKQVQSDYAEQKSDSESHKSLKQKPVVEETSDHSSQIGGLDMKHLMSHKGLAQSVVMSEVLGPPRALKPYRSIIEERRR